MKKSARSFLSVILVFVAISVFINFALADSYQLTAPTNNTFTAQQNTNFTINVTFDRSLNTSLTNISLWMTQDAGLEINATNLTTNAFEIGNHNNTLYNFSLLLNEGRYNWTFSITFQQEFFLTTFKAD